MLTLYKNTELSEVDYRKLDNISQSALRSYALAPTPLHFSMQSQLKCKPSPAMELGRLLHSRIEHGDAYFKQHITLPKGMRKGSKAFKELEGHGNCTFVKSADAEIIEQMYSSILKNDGAKKLLSSGFNEESFVGDIDGIDVKGRFDFRNPELRVIVDFKTSLTGSPYDYRGFSKVVKDSKYAWQAAFYLDAIQRLTQQEYVFVFMVIEKSYPFACSLHTLSEDDLRIAHEEVFSCLNELNDRKKNNDWGDGYGSTIHTLNMGF